MKCTQVNLHFLRIKFQNIWEIDAVVYRTAVLTLQKVIWNLILDLWVKNYSMENIAPYPVIITQVWAIE